MSKANQLFSPSIKTGSIDGSSNISMLMKRAQALRTNPKDFELHYEGLGKLMQSLTIKDLLSNLNIVLKRLYRASQIAFFIANKELCEQM